MPPEPLRAVVVAGPNGSGKTTLTEALRTGSDLGFPFPARYINADWIADELRREGHSDPESAAFHRGRALRQQYREERVSFAYETVLSHPSGLLDLLRLHEAGYELTLVVVTTDNPELNVARVIGRVRSGGHSVPSDRIRSRYERSVTFLPRAIEIAGTSWVFDASDRMRLSLQFQRGNLEFSGWAPDYLVQRVVRPIENRRDARAVLRRQAPDGCSWVVPDEDRGDYLGTVTGSILPYACTQQLAPDTWVCHDGVLLTAPVQVGDRARIHYRSGYAVVEVE